MAESIELSIVVPMYNEAAVIGLFFDRITRVLASITGAYEIVCVNDGSIDDTSERLLKAHHENPRIKIVNLTRNFGKEAALTAGIEHASGRAVIPIDADLQDDPELIPQMVDKWREGNDIVVAVRSERDEDSVLKRLTANGFYRVMGRLSEVPILPHAGDFRLMDRRVIAALKHLPERTRFMKGLFAWTGFRQAVVTYSRQARAAGSSKWRYWKLWNFALDGITAFTTLPLRIWTYLGVLTAVLAFIYASYIIANTLIFGVDVPGYASIIVILLFFNGLNMLSLGILGEYLARVYAEVKQRPIYLVRDRYGFEEHDFEEHDREHPARGEVSALSAIAPKLP
jgi:glycosyltransferase involved in cell wall biosynthesis